MPPTRRQYYRQSRLKQLRAFCATARLGSMSRAAEALTLSQPSVSLQVRALEDEMDTILFERRGPKIDLTPEGQTLYEIASPLIQGLDKLPEEFASRRGLVEGGQLDIAAGESTILYLLPDFVARFSAAFPGVRVRLHNVTGRDGLALLRADKVDMAVGSMVQVDDDVRYQPLFTYDTKLIVPLGHPLSALSSATLEDVADYGLILPPRDLTTWRTVDSAFRSRGLEYKVILEAGGWEVIKRYVEVGLGISIVTSICLRGDERLVPISLSEYSSDRSYGVVTRRGRFLSPAARNFIATISDRGFVKEATGINERGFE
jgi:DNA-binding transcriptional LysR family regulator